MPPSAIPFSPPSKRSPSPSLERSRPSKRSHPALDTAPPSPPDTSILTSLEHDALDRIDARLSATHYGMDLDPRNSEAERDDAPVVKRKDKGKEKALPQVELPEQVWTRVFEHYYDNVYKGVWAGSGRRMYRFMHCC